MKNINITVFLEYILSSPLFFVKLIKKIPVVFCSSVVTDVITCVIIGNVLCGSGIRQFRGIVGVSRALKGEECRRLRRTVLREMKWFLIAALLSTFAYRVRLLSNVRT